MMLLAIALALSGDAQAGDLDLGVGLRDPGALTELLSNGGRAFGGVQGLARYRMGWVTLEADLYYHPLTERYTELDAVIVRVAEQAGGSVDFQLPVDNETLSLQALVNVGLPLDPEARWAGGPTLLAGAWGGYATDGHLVSDPNDPSGVAFINNGKALRLGPAMGLGVEGWYAGRVGLRLSWLARLSLQDEPTFDPNVPPSGRALVNTPAFTLDMMVNL